jgi:peptidoglycan/LPS O-acetylase OafA/YrhL
VIAPINIRHIPTLDGLRAIAITMVIGSHTRADDSPGYFLANGYVGVLIFFALSGYLITTHLIWEYDATGRISIRNFYERRAFRILPPALLYLAVLAALSSIGLIECGWPSIRAALFFYANYADHDWAVSHFWSLSVEEHFYLLWPALLIAFGVLRGWRTAVIMVVGIVILRLFVNRFHLLNGVFSDIAHGNFHSDLIADTLLWGCGLAFYLRRPVYALRPVSSTIVAVTAAVMMLAPLSWNLNRFTLLKDLIPTILLGAIVAVPQAPIGRLLELPLLRYVGRLSYSLYLWQQLFLTGPGPHLPVLFALAAIFACAILSYELIERPSIRFGRNLQRRRIASKSPEALRRERN